MLDDVDVSPRIRSSFSYMNKASALPRVRARHLTFVVVERTASFAFLLVPLVLNWKLA